MPQTRPRSSFFDSPVGRGLLDVADAPAAGRGGRVPPEMPGLAGFMRPSLRNALADATGEAALLELESEAPFLVEDPGSPDMPGVFGQPRTRVINPRETLPPHLQQMRAEDQFRRGYGVETELGAERERSSLHNQAEADDYSAGLAARRYWDPYTQSMLADEHGRKMALATEPARLAASSRENVASTTAAGRVGTAQATASGRLGQEAIRSYDDWIAKGAFGFDDRGYPLPPPPEVENFMRRFLGQSTGQPSFTPEQEALIQQGVNDGHSREEVVAYLRSIGRLK